jgi:L,D-transpeptidase YcbB
MFRLITILYAFTYVIFCPGSQENLDRQSPDSRTGDGLVYPGLVAKFYTARNNRPFWFTAAEDAVQLRLELKKSIDSTLTTGANKSRYHYNEINRTIHQSYLPADSTTTFTLDKRYTDAAITLSEDLYRGYDISKWILSDQVSSARKNDDDNFLLQQLLAVKSESDLAQLFYSLTPNDSEYVTIFQPLYQQKKTLSPFQKKEILLSLNLYRWIHHFHFKKWIVVNISSATLRYYEEDSLNLRMKVIVGKPSTRTPCFAAYCNQVILYPYWNVPQSITLKELLPDFKRNPATIDNLNMQIIDSKGNIVDYHKLNWKEYNRNYFPFRVRQSTGCDNSLGVIKFDLTSPFSVYLHDTNAKNLFKYDRRYFSHGCIRLEQPLQLADYLLPNAIDSSFLAACLKNETPRTLPLAEEVPVFVIYQPVEALDGQVHFFRDVYRLLK